MLVSCCSARNVSISLIYLKFSICSIIDRTLFFFLFFLFNCKHSMRVSNTKQWHRFCCSAASKPNRNVNFVILRPVVSYSLEYSLTSPPAAVLFLFYHPLHLKQHCGHRSTLPRLIATAELAPWRSKHDERSPFADIILGTVSPHPPINHPWAWKSRSTPLLGFLWWQGRDLIRTINTRKWPPWASVLSVHVMKRSSVLGFFLVSFLDGATWQNLTKSRRSKTQSCSKESEEKLQQPSGFFVFLSEQPGNRL